MEMQKMIEINEAGRAMLSGILGLTVLFGLAAVCISVQMDWIAYRDHPLTSFIEWLGAIAFVIALVGFFIGGLAMIAFVIALVGVL
jgi:hypothetical protein